MLPPAGGTLEREGLMCNNKLRLQIAGDKELPAYEMLSHSES
jgi:hypothetical protein